VTETRKPLLIVEDDPALQKQMQWAFDQYETIVATDRESAIAQLRRYEPSVCRLSLTIPPRGSGCSRRSMPLHRTPK
jgi:two-component system NtrC family response regulator